MEFSYEYTIIENTENIPPQSGTQTECTFPGSQSAVESGYPLNYSTRWNKISNIDILLDRIRKSVKCYLILDSTYF